MSYEKLAKAVEVIAEATGRPRHDAAVVLGSGLGEYATTLRDGIEIPYQDIPQFPVTKVEGHAGSLFSAMIGDHPVLVFAGRVHAYEGWEMEDIVFGVRCAALSGRRAVLLTNASGGIGDYLRAGDLVAVSDHINLTGRNPLEGPNDERFGPRFPDLSDVYTEAFHAEIEAVAQSQAITYKQGVYAWLLGPSYETPAEIQMLKWLGADLVGMSTVPEAIALAHMGVKVACVSLVTNMAAGISTGPLSHEEVQAMATLTKEKFTRFVNDLMPRLIALAADS